VSDIPKTMRAVVYRDVNDLRLETVPVPRIGANELLVKVAVCGVCRPTSKKSSTASSRRRASSATKPPAPSSALVVGRASREPF